MEDVNKVKGGVSMGPLRKFANSVQGRIFAAFLGAMSLVGCEERDYTQRVAQHYVAGGIYRGNFDEHEVTNKAVKALNEKEKEAATAIESLLSGSNVEGIDVLQDIEGKTIRVKKEGSVEGLKYDEYFIKVSQTGRLLYVTLSTPGGLKIIGDKDKTINDYEERENAVNITISAK